MEPTPDDQPPNPSFRLGQAPRSGDPTRSERSFRFLVPTQFLGAFNDNAFKQLILLLAADITLRELQEGGKLSYQALATGLFALPFVLFSGVAGSLADKYSKTRIVLWAKVAEIGIMGMGAVGFWLRDMNLLFSTLFLMGTQSAFFGPAKYGILPELLPRTSLSRGNGVIMMTTFVAIILGMATAGALRERLPALHLAGLFCVLLAGLGTVTALGVARMPAAQPGLRVRGRWMGDLWPTFRRIARDPGFILVVCFHSYFWFLGAVMQQTLNVYGLELMRLDAERTSYLLVTLSVGMAAGGIIGGWLSRGTINFQLTVWGLLGVVLALALLTQSHHSLVFSHVVLLLLGVSGSLFCLPLQTYIQHRPPEGEKGRVVAAANFANWVFILLSAAVFWLLRVSLPVQWVPGCIAACTLLLGLCIIPRLKQLQREVE